MKMSVDLRSSAGTSTPSRSATTAPLKKGPAPSLRRKKYAWSPLLASFHMPHAPISPSVSLCWLLCSISPKRSRDSSRACSCGCGGSSSMTFMAGGTPKCGMRICCCCCCCSGDMGSGLGWNGTNASETVAMRSASDSPGDDASVEKSGLCKERLCFCWRASMYCPPASTASRNVCSETSIVSETYGRCDLVRSFILMLSASIALLFKFWCACVDAELFATENPSPACM
mmetsp:Transcript_1359/g.2921  ORF Transcript_1359/g.2921 Transcript_1359/m.2921 type:complete len:229 (-) Transcript_1359:609-1295(-)